MYVCMYIHSMYIRVQSMYMYMYNMIHTRAHTRTHTSIRLLACYTFACLLAHTRMLTVCLLLDCGGEVP